MAAGSGKTPVPPLAAFIQFNGNASTPQHFDVTHYDGDTETDFGEHFDLSSTGGVGPVTLSYEVVGHIGQGFISNQAHNFYSNTTGTTLSTAATMAAAWGLGGAMVVGEQASISIRCKAVDSLGTVATSASITVTFTRTV